MIADACCERTCFYCDKDLGILRHEHDHMPAPKRLGGTETVPACMDCHHMKDRTSLRDWPVSSLLEAFKGSSPLGRILMARMYAALLDHQAPHTST